MNRRDQIIFLLQSTADFDGEMYDDLRDQWMLELTEIDNKDDLENNYTGRLYGLINSKNYLKRFSEINEIETIIEDEYEAFKKMVNSKNQEFNEIFNRIDAQKDVCMVFLGSTNNKEDDDDDTEDDD